LPKPTDEELADEEKRSTAVGFFNFAETYRTAARTLRGSRAKSTHKESPIRHAYYHAIELYLKAYLRGKSIHPYDLRVKFRHGVGALSKKAAEFGLEFDDEDIEVFELMTDTDAVIRSRYISAGYFTWPDIAALDRTCNSLRQSVAASLKKSGHFVRL
jgi:HEPN domain-containing protein